MQLKSAVNPRKTPKQKRSQASVDALLEATVRILSDDPNVKITTRGIADTAGVAIGSLYQYFPNKETILGLLIDKRIEECTRMVASRMIELSDASLKVRATEIVKLLLEINTKNLQFEKAVIKYIPQVGRIHKLREAQNYIIQLVAKQLSKEKCIFGSRNVEMATFILVHAVEAVIDVIVSERQGYLNDPTLAEELTKLVLGYLA